MHASRQARLSAAEARDKLVNELKNAVADAETWHFDGVVHDREDGPGLGRHVETTVQAANAYVKTNPWAAVGVGAAAGLLVGLLLSRR